MERWRLTQDVWAFTAPRKNRKKSGTCSLPIPTPTTLPASRFLSRMPGHRTASVRGSTRARKPWIAYIGTSLTRSCGLTLCPCRRKCIPSCTYAPSSRKCPIEADRLPITPVPVNHVVPTLAYIVRDQAGAIIVAGDTGPTTRLWELARETAGLRAIFLEASFPNSLKRLADVSLHLTSNMFGREVAKMPAGVKVLAVPYTSKFAIAKRSSASYMLMDCPIWRLASAKRCTTFEVCMLWRFRQSAKCVSAGLEGKTQFMLSFQFSS